VLAVDNQTIPQMIKILLELDHPHINITSLYTFLWCLWKTRNAALFGRKYCKPPEANAIMQGSKLDDLLQAQNQHSSFDVVHRQITQQEPCLTIGQRIFCDAAWTMEENMQSSPAGIGVIIQFEDNEHCKQLHISAMSPPVTSSL
jgi:hypothetical protein